MDFWTICFSLYLSVAIFAVIMTYCEQSRRKTPSPLFDVLGFLVCTIWPVVLAAVLVEQARRQIGPGQSR